MIKKIPTDVPKIRANNNQTDPRGIADGANTPFYTHDTYNRDTPNRYGTANAERVLTQPGDCKNRDVGRQFTLQAKSIGLHEKIEEKIDAKNNLRLFKDVPKLTSNPDVCQSILKKLSGILPGDVIKLIGRSGIPLRMDTSTIPHPAIKHHAYVALGEMIRALDVLLGSETLQLSCQRPFMNIFKSAEEGFKHSDSALKDVAGKTQNDPRAYFKLSCLIYLAGRYNPPNATRVCTRNDLKDFDSDAYNFIEDVFLSKVPEALKNKVTLTPAQRTRA